MHIAFRKMDQILGSRGAFEELSDAFPISSVIYVGILFIVGGLFLTRWFTKRSLERYSNLPTVLWRPRFANYVHGKMMNVGSSITNILPKMKRMGEKKYGMFGTVYGVSTKVVHIAHPVPAHLVLGTSPITHAHQDGVVNRKQFKNERGFQLGALKRPAYNHFFNFSGQGVFTSDGEDWHRKRSSVIHSLFRGSQGSSFSDRIELEANLAADNFINEVKHKNRNDRVDELAEIDIVPILQRSTIGMIYRYITKDDFLQPLSLNDNSKAIEESSDLNEYLDAVTKIRMIILAQARSIWFLLPRWIYTYFSSMYRQEERIMDPIRKFARQACDRAKPGSPLDALRKRVSHMDKSLPNQNSISKNMLDETITLLFAGQDTSAATLSWTLHLLSLYPDCQRKLYNEVADVFNDSSCEEKKDADMKPNDYLCRSSLSRLKYLDAVIKESMRLYPVAPFVVRSLPHDIRVPESDIILSKGSFACVWIYGLHRNNHFWHRPNSFIPERWLEENLQRKDKGQKNGSYMPFAAGPRSCLGQSIGNIVLRTMLARIIHKFFVSDSRLKSEDDVLNLHKDMQAGFTVLPSGGLNLALQSRYSDVII